MAAAALARQIELGCGYQEGIGVKSKERIACVTQGQFCIGCEARGGTTMKVGHRPDHGSLPRRCSELGTLQCCTGRRF